MKMVGRYTEEDWLKEKEARERSPPDVFYVPTTLGIYYATMRCNNGVFRSFRDDNSVLLIEDPAAGVSAALSEAKHSKGEFEGDLPLLLIVDGKYLSNDSHLHPATTSGVWWTKNLPLAYCQKYRPIDAAPGTYNCPVEQEDLAAIEKIVEKLHGVKLYKREVN